ncbi:MAG: hypothetical protein K0Q46_2502 [Rhodococcus erythropolis]|jgi:hypothetical protein|nr:hypothetical protein [Rhodococcus erythropolis]MDF2895716.1 hypothetical protein [Rhodococcus erythropolis]
MSEFWAGVLVLPVAAVVGGLGFWLLVGARRAWVKTHEALLFQRVKLAKDRINPFGPKPDGTTYEKAANRLRDALLETPRLLAFGGLGWRIFVVRDSKANDDDRG